MDRKPNEVLLSRELLEQLLVEGLPRTYRVDRGPAPEARLVNVRWAGEWVVLEYDRPVEEPLLSIVHATGGPVGTYARPFVVGESGPEQLVKGQHPGEIGLGWV